MDETKQRVESFLKSELQNISTTRLMHEGDPARLIVEYAEKENVDLIMMPTHGYGPFRRFLLGSVTRQSTSRPEMPGLGERTRAVHTQTTHRISQRSAR
jgi:Universal stress protein family